MPSTQIRNAFRRALRSQPSMRVGFQAVDALQHAIDQIKWDALEYAGFVRVIAEPDPFMTYEEAVERGDDNGESWGTLGQYRLDPDSDEWVTADSVWGYVGYRNVLDPDENVYVRDIMAETMDQFRAAWKKHVSEACPCCHGSGRR